MSFAKWVGGALGWSFGGPIGAIIGLAIGSIIDGSTNGGGFLLGDGNTTQQRRPRRTTSRTRTQTRNQPQTRSGDFEVSLLILASVVIKADGKQDQSELDFVRKQFVSMYDLEANLDLYYLDLLSYREVSNETGYKFQVIHQSPQLLIIKNGVAVAHASHGGISEVDLEKFV